MISPTKNLCQAARVDAPALPIISRQEALATGARFYFTGKPCPKGHICERYTSGGNRGKCVRCFKERVKRYFETYRRPYYEKNKEKFAQWSRESHERNKEERNERNSSWQRNNRQKANEYVTKWRENNRDLFRKICRDWVRNNKDKVHAKRAARLSADGRFTAADVTEIMLDQKGRCAMPVCRKKLNGEFDVDHIVPLKRGGSNWRKNIQLLCPTCNARKGARDPIDHSRSLGLLL